MKKRILVLLVALYFIAPVSYAELNEAEEQVVFYMNYLQEMSYTAEYTEGVPKKDVESYLTENINFISETFKISPADINALMMNKNHNRPLPETYTAPTMPTEEQLMDMTEKMKKSVAHYSTKTKSYKPSSEGKEIE